MTEHKQPDWTELEAAAREATPGPWNELHSMAGPMGVIAGSVDDERMPRVCWLDMDGKEHANARFIALANPETILSLLSALRAVEGERDEAREDAEDAQVSADTWLAEHKMSEARASTAEAERDEAIRQRDIARNLHAAEIQFTDAATNRASTAEARVAELEGWKLVPVEPTEEMLRAGYEATHNPLAMATGGFTRWATWDEARRCDGFRQDKVKAYSAMLSASPAPAVPGEEG